MERFIILLLCLAFGAVMFHVGTNTAIENHQNRIEQNIERNKNRHIIITELDYDSANYYLGRIFIMQDLENKKTCYIIDGNGSGISCFDGLVNQKPEAPEPRAQSPEPSL